MGIQRQIGEPSSGYAECVATSGSGRTIHVSGNVGFGPDGTVVDGSFEDEVRATFANIEQVLKQAGAQLSDVVRITTFMTSLDDYGSFAKVRAELFGSDLPASSAVQVAGLLVGARIEIEAVAFVAD